MAYVMKKFEKERIELRNLDASGETWADVNHAKGSDRMKIDQIRVRPEYTYQLDNGDTTVERLPVSPYILKARVVWTLLVDTNILNSEERKWFTPGLEWPQFLELWDSSDTEVQEELYQAVIQVNPQIAKN